MPKITDVNALQPRNDCEPILVTDSGMVIDANLEQFWNALESILLTREVGVNVTDVKLEQNWNAFCPILDPIVVLAMVTDDKLKHEMNALVPMLVTDSGMVIDVNPEDWNA